MKPHEQCKKAGLSSLAELSEITKVSIQTLNNWSKNKPILFKVVILGAKILKDWEKLPGSETASGQSPKLPDLDKCYQDIPFPEDEKECAFFVAGISELHKYLTCKC